MRVFLLRHGHVVRVVDLVEPVVEQTDEEVRTDLKEAGEEEPERAERD